MDLLLTGVSSKMESWESFWLTGENSEKVMESILYRQILTRGKIRVFKAESISMTYIHITYSKLF